MAKKKDVLLDHNYDGIQELDNDLPSWWLWLFYFTIFFAAAYLLHFHVLKTGKSALAKYELEMNPNWQPPEQSQPHFSGLRYHSPYYSPKGEVTPRIKKMFSSYIGPEIDFNELVQEAMKRADAAGLAKLQEAFPDLYAQLEEHGGPVQPREATAAAAAAAEPETKEYERLTDKASLSAGKDIYIKNCATCHGQNGEGGIGPNMTDDYWLHGAGIDNMVHTIKNGVPAKGMISWRSILNDKQVVQVASYLMSLYGSNPPNAKKPQGEKVDMSEYMN